ncbi:uncharacterized protein Bfra_009234 [Botrytis fragariae]|uniref:Uncharacterized protein n=1 Tax=Botrytis fragariae TaxID=1964551 RepID=A0A8H6ANF5_9HELO|nr:uncharacterized protein Bfra_009234 [Botrytis fragariae]KAF5870687.1 hypothetical protein Bfra_009234 [Botrytis fragariae]
MSYHSGSSSGQTHSSSGAGSDRMFFRVGSSQTSSRSGSSRSSVSTNPSRVFSNSSSTRSSASTNSIRTSGSSVSSQMSYGSNSNGRSSNSGSIQSTVNGLEPHINARKHAKRQHKIDGWSGPRLKEDPRVKVYADKKSDQMERKARAERKFQSEMRKKEGFYIEDDMA